MPAKPSAQMFSFCGQGTDKTILRINLLERVSNQSRSGRKTAVIIACSLALGLLAPISLSAAIPAQTEAGETPSEYYEAGFGGVGVAVAGGALGVLLLVSGVVEFRKNGIWRMKRKSQDAAAVVVGPITEPPSRPALSERGSIKISIPGDLIPMLSALSTR